MGAYFRSFGWPLGTVFLVLTVVWIIGMIVLPQLSMIERAFVFIDRGSALSTVGVDANRLSRDIALADLDLRTLKARLAATAEETAPASPSLPTPSIATPSLPSPTVTVPSLPTPGVPTPGVPTIGVPTASSTLGGGNAEPADIAAQISALETRRRDLQGQMTELRETEARLREEAASAPRYSLKNFATMSRVHFHIFLSTLFYATLVTVIAFLVCYPVAYAVATSRNAGRTALLLLALVIPYAINELLRIFAWVMILEREGIINALLTSIGVFAPGDAPRWVASNWAVFTVMIYAYVLFMVFPLYNTLDTLDRNQIEAARDLGASSWKLHTRVVIPHAKPGIAVGSIMVFMLSAGSIAAPEIVGRGLHPDWFSQVIYRRFFESSNWNQGSAYSLMLLVACVAFIMLVMSLFRVSIRDIAK